MIVKIDEDSDKVITGHKFDLKAINEKIESTEKLMEVAQERDSKKLKELRDDMKREEDSRRQREINMIYGSRLPKSPEAPKSPVAYVVKTQEEIDSELTAEQRKKLRFFNESL